jgi:UDP:flavonoid glycosyltransferase YjiC (YdhE family)/glycosyltransferase involved in cell wall biosynthesis
MEPMRSYAQSARRQVDILMVSDLRFPGGTSHSMAEEITAQAQAGWSTGLVHLNGPLLSRVRPVNLRIREQLRRGAAKLFVGDQSIRAKVVVVRHPGVLQAAVEQLPPVETDHVVLVANAPPIDIDGHRHYRPAAVDRIARERFGVAPVWAPIGPLVREAIASDVPASGLREQDWVNIIDVDAWRVHRPGWHSDRPVIGRHSRGSPQKWPTDSKVIEAVYPLDGSAVVEILGGADPVLDVLGHLPSSWRVIPFGAMDPRDFLAQLDFFAYYHHPAWVEAFGRNILEALASGLPAILPPHFRPLFGDAALYAEPAEVPSLVRRLYDDRAAYEDIATRADSAVRARFGYKAHHERLAELIGWPETVAQQPSPTSPRRAAPARPTLMLISSNGSGMGHLTRLMAYARRAVPDLVPHFVSLSQAVGVVAQYGYSFEYVPSAAASGLSSRRWHDLFTERVADAVTRLRPAVVVFDGTRPYEGIPRVRDAHPDARWVWSRRGMWRRGKSVAQLAKASWFDLVLAPGELAAAYDRGPTSKADGIGIGPVTLLDADELDDRDAARRALGLPPDRRLALVALGAGNINDTSQETGAVVAALRRLGIDTCVTQSEIAASDRGQAGMHVVREFPLSRRFRAFDLAVSASGYNSFHELLRFGIPTLFIPNQDTALDDQQGRARFASDRGLAHMLGRVSVDRATSLLSDLLQRGPDMVANVASVDSGNGAAGAVAQLRELAARAGCG